ncbi:(3R)-3-[(carboxymethyl)amino]fatty acid oxygenase/decarboxylase [Streptomyces ipomoeae]|uniref:(3R)-3-[(carboxymethyl)amino]fatty acid oxygenase/decarboxylase n=1 Tax=Streptomyces ipomoeae TaxID=103232 RepID=UPI001FD11CEE|nr:TauD/TfdA family dioxygenase [Streptomyces ipomoeae]MDX2937676.1 TauD/TfdA family dioxygenase [Streptomyces ipomoeae]
MNITAQVDAAMGVAVEGFNPLTAPEEEIQELKKLVYSEKIVILKNQDLDPPGFISLGRRLGRVETYYQPMYHHPEHKEIFVSSNVKKSDTQIGVPQTGKFWHADYSFMPNPFGLTLIYPQVVPKKNRGTYFIDMGAAYQALSDDLKARLAGANGVHTAGIYFKIRPSDVYRPISEVLADIERETPPVRHPLVIEHPVTGESVLYLSQGLTSAVEDRTGQPDADLLTELFEASGQLDSTFTHKNIHLQTFDKGDLLVWDNRSLIHRALHTEKPEPTVSYRVTVHDEFPFYKGIAAR